ncbi:MAG: glycosyltransferase [Alphaproteobacteria bacterium]
MRLQNIGILALLAAATAAFWVAFNQPRTEPGWNGRITGISYSPYRAGQNPNGGPHPTPDQIDEDLRILSERVDRVRVYSTQDGQDVVPELAQKYDMTVTLGAWVDDRKARSEREVRDVVRLARTHRNVDRVIVGNESLLRRELTVPELIQYIKRVRDQIQVPVSTAETWDVWLANPQLAEAVDFIAVQILPYWDGTEIDQAVESVFARYQQMRRTFPDKKIVLSEVGWPSDGRMRLDSVPSRVNQASFVRQFLARADDWGLDYYVIEAFDQPWKHSTEGGVGAYWGIWNVDRTPKFAYQGPLQERPAWPMLAGASVALGLLFSLIFFRSAGHLRFAGRLLYAGMLQALAVGTVWVAYVTATKYLTLSAMVVWGMLVLAMVMLAVILLAEGREMVDALWTRTMRRGFRPIRPDGEVERRWPKVSIHLPIYNEPPQMVMQTIDSLLRLDYPALEIVVVDNNTKDEDVWRPVEAYCADKTDRVKFIHVPHCPGFKAEALNIALAHTAPDAELIGVVDSDYLVQSDWLKSLVPYFDRAEVGFVQAPQDHRDAHVSPFKRMINWEYAGFFNIGMVQRNEDNAIIQHGTMTVIRRSALEATGKWGQWCIVEDAELGLRLLEAGWESVYVNHSFGHGLSPDSFAGFKRQRFRWAYGAVQILKRHWRALLPWDRSTKLTGAQRYHFVMGWLPWFADALSVVLAVLGLVWTVGLLAAPKHFDFPLTIFLAPTIAVFAFKLIRFLWLYSAKVKCDLGDCLRAGVAGLALTYTIGYAMLAGLFTRKLPFMRTPKMENRPALIQALAMARTEATMLVLLIAGALAVGLRFGTLDREAWVWSATLLVQATPYAAAVYTAVRDALPTLASFGLRKPAIGGGNTSSGAADARP